MTNQVYLDIMSPEERKKNKIDGIAGIVELFASQIKEGLIIVDGDSLYEDEGEFIMRFAQ